jgi:hypothetical protein
MGVVLAALAVALAASVIMIALAGTYVRIRTAGYDAEKGRAELELMRLSLESKLYELNHRLMTTESRWMDANHLLLDSQGFATETTSIAENALLSGAGLTDEDVQIDPKLVFVLMPLHPEFQSRFGVIRGFCNDLGLQALRGDEEFISGEIMRHVLRMIAKARLIVALVDGRNPNVFYELGVAHALGKQVILVSTDVQALPFDLQSRRLVLAKSDEVLKERLAAEIGRALV